ncbi:alpha/beta hydrolase [Rhodococcus sp. H36-A4]|uniref:alpha/beta fold hydrolase n=1 Tax=Rhodococcus sp. H36-A4 TaxID=3004353 RepID=UPI0022AFAF93|nr:alpha/beta hydrolase [Rhodococcus sp. H36-A4]MCZ4077686.1 alpha/beta hydrolase [Rhodococcus sp. H36-A4]
MRRLLYFHGAGGFIDDRPIAEGLADRLGCAVEMPHIPDEDMSFEAWATIVRRCMDAMKSGDLVVAHSFGASILLRVLAEKRRAIPSNAVLLAMPDWTPQGWDVEDYAFTGPEPEMALALHHCRDDDVVPFAHLKLHSIRLPSASVHEHRSGGHQFVGVLDTIAACWTV